MKLDLKDRAVLAEIQWEISVAYWGMGVSLSKIFKQQGISHKLGNALLLSRKDTELLSNTSAEWVRLMTRKD
jgi:hypothetical protein